MKRKIGRLLNRLLSPFGVCVHRVKNEEDETPIKVNTKEINENVPQPSGVENKWIRDYGFKTVIDIGANEGQFAQKISEIIPSIRLICFEPLKTPFDILKSKFSNHQNSFFQFALGRKEAEVFINRNEYSPSSSLLPMAEIHKKNFSFARKESPEKILIKMLGKITKNMEVLEPFIIKIDVQGYEIEVMSGGKEFIKKADMIIIETSFFKLYEGGPLFADVYGFLIKNGFVYAGSFEQLISPINDAVLQQDSVFVKPKVFEIIWKENHAKT